MPRRSDLIRRMIIAGRARDRGMRRDSNAEERVDVAKLQQEVERLESLVEGLQDAVHRESQRTDRRIAELAAQLRPAELARTLDDESRRRGTA